MVASCCAISDNPYSSYMKDKNLSRTVMAVPDEDHRSRTGAARREATRAKLLSAAVRVFASKGLDAPQIDDFIAAAGVARGTFYNYFKTSAEVLDVVTAELTDEVLYAIESHVKHLEDPLLRVVTACRLYMNTAIDYPAWGAFMIRSASRRDATGRLVNVYIPRDLTLAREQGLVQFDSVQAARDLLLGSIRMAAVSGLSGVAPREHLDEVMRLVLRALGVKAATSRSVCAFPLPLLELPPALKLLHDGAQQADAASP